MSENLFVQALETSRKVSFKYCPASQQVQVNYIFSNNIGITSVCPAMSKSLKQLPNCLRGVDTSIILIAFDGVLCEI